MTRGWADLYAWQLDRASRTPLTRQIYMQVRSAVLSGALCPGTRVPSSRTMASKLGVARASVVSRQIYMQVRSAVLSGALCPGTRVPSSRAMASKLGVARASVVSAYEQLLAEGYVAH